MQTYYDSVEAATGQSHRNRPNFFAEADDLLAAAINRIAEGRSMSAAGATKTCALVLELLQGVRVPVRRLANIQPDSGGAI